jgi:hypothetical protein
VERGRGERGRRRSRAGCGHLLCAWCSSRLTPPPGTRTVGTACRGCRRQRVWKAAHLESRPKASARLDLDRDASAGWARPSSCSTDIRLRRYGAGDVDAAVALWGAALMVLGESRG